MYCLLAIDDSEIYFVRSLACESRCSGEQTDLELNAEVILYLLRYITVLVDTYKIWHKSDEVKRIGQK